MESALHFSAPVSFELRIWVSFAFTRLLFLSVEGTVGTYLHIFPLCTPVETRVGSSIVKTGKGSGAMKDLKYTDKFLLTMREAHTKKH